MDEGVGEAFDVVAEVSDRQGFLTIRWTTIRHPM